MNLNQKSFDRSTCHRTHLFYCDVQKFCGWYLSGDCATMNRRHKRHETLKAIELKDAKGPLYLRADCTAMYCLCCKQSEASCVQKSRRYSLTLKITSYYNDFKLCQRDMMVKRITYPNLVKFPFYFTDILSGWWFGTCFIFYFIYGMSSFPLTFIFFRGVGQPPTRLTIIYHGKSPFSMGKSPFWMGKSQFWMGKSPFWMGKSQFWMGKSSFWMGKSPFWMDKSW